MTVDPRFTHVQPVIAKPLRAIGHTEFGWIALIQSHPLSIAWLRGRIGSEGLMQQVHLARACATHMALAYHQAGFAVVIDDFWDAYHDADYQVLHAIHKSSKIQTVPEFPTFAGIHPLPQITGARWDERTVQLKYPKLAAKFMSR